MKPSLAVPAALLSAVFQAFTWLVQPVQPTLAHEVEGSAATTHERRLPERAKEPAMLAALRANGARVLELGERGGLDGHFVELAGGDAYGLYLTPDGHAVAGLLYGPDGTLLTSSQIEAVRGGEAAGSHAGRQVSGAPPNEAAPVPPELRADVASLGSAVGSVHAHATDPAASGGGTSRQVEALFQRSGSAFGFTLGHTPPGGHTPSGGHTGPVAVAFADPGCRWSRAAVARLARPALDGRLRLHVVPVGVLGAASAREAAAIASAADPAMAWFEGAAGHASPEGGRRIARNNALFDAWGAGAVPLIAWRARDGRVAHRVGDVDDIGAWLGGLRHE